jgi:hypothetical protein
VSDLETGDRNTVITLVEQERTSTYGNMQMACRLSDGRSSFAAKARFPPNPLSHAFVVAAPGAPIHVNNSEARGDFPALC